MIDAQNNFNLVSCNKVFSLPDFEQNINSHNAVVSHIEQKKFPSQATQMFSVSRHRILFHTESCNIWPVDILIMLATTGCRHSLISPLSTQESETHTNL